MDSSDVDNLHCDNNGSIIFGNIGESPRLETLDKSIFIVALGLGISLFILSLACLIFNCVLRHNRIIKMSSPRLNMVIASGGMLASVCCVLEGTYYFLAVESSTSNYVCHFRYGLLAASFTLVYGPMIGRTWRVNRIFKLAGYRRVVIRDYRLLLYTSALLCVDVIVFVVWVLVDPLEYKYTTRLESTTTDPCHLQPSDIFVVPACSSNWTTLWAACFVAVKLPFLVVGLRECWWTKGDLLPKINDSASLIVSILATIAMATVAAVTSQAFAAYPDVTKCCLVGSLWMASVVTIAAVFFPKLLLWKRTPRGCVNRMSISSTSSTKAVLHSFGQMESELNTANSEIETLKDFIREKENSIEKLQRLLSDAEENLTQFNIDNAMTSPPTNQSDYDNGQAQANVKAGVLWLGGEHSECPGLQDHEDYCSCNGSIDNINVSTKINKNNNNNNNTQDSNPNPPHQQQLKSILHTATTTTTTPTRRTSISTASSVTNSELSKSIIDDSNEINQNSRNYANQIDSEIINNNHNNNKMINNCEKYKNAMNSKQSNENNNNNDNTMNNYNNPYNRQHGIINQQFHSQNSSYGSHGNKLSVLEKPILKRSPSPLNGNHYNKNPLSSGGKNDANAINSNKAIDTKKYTNNNNNNNNSNTPSNNNTATLPADYIDYQGDGPLLFNTTTNDTNPSLSALQKRYLRRRRSSTSSIASLSKLNRLRSDLNDALQLSHALRSGWSRDIEDMERYKRQVKMARKARRKSVPGFQNITESIMASYNFQPTADNETFISDCISTSEWSSDITRNSRMSLASSSQSSRSVNKGRRYSECDFYFPYDRSGNLDNATIQLDAINDTKDNVYDKSMTNNRGFDHLNFNSNPAIPTINEPIEDEATYDVKNDVRIEGRRGSTPLGTISGRIGPASLYGSCYPAHVPFGDVRSFNFPSDRQCPDVFAQGYYNETASDFLGPTTSRPILTSDSLYPPPQRHRRWSGGMETERGKGGNRDNYNMPYYYRREGGGRVRDNNIMDTRIVLGRRDNNVRVNRAFEEEEEEEMEGGSGGRVERVLMDNDKALSPRLVHSDGRSGGNIIQTIAKQPSTVLAVPRVRNSHSCSSSNSKNAVTFADSVVMTPAGKDRKGNGNGTGNDGKDGFIFTSVVDNGNSLSVPNRPKFHRSVSDNILSSRRRDYYYHHREETEGPTFIADAGAAGVDTTLRRLEPKYPGGNGINETSFGLVEQFRTTGERSNVHNINTNTNYPSGRGRGITANINQSGQRLTELSVVPRDLPVVIRDNNTINGHNIPSPSPSFLYQQQRYDRQSERGSQININVLVDSRTRDQGHTRHGGGGGFRQSFA